MAYPAKIKAKAQKLYESGMSQRDIAAELTIHWRTVQEWVEKGEWIKCQIVDKMLQKEEEGILALAKEIGLDQRLVLETAKELLEAKCIAIPTATSFAQLPLDPNKKPNEDGTYKFMGGGEYEAIPDRKSNTEGLKMAADMLKMREKDQSIDQIAIPIIINNQDGQTLFQLGVKNG